MSDPTVQKIHPATPHRRELARREGRVAQSHDLAAAVVLLGGSIVVAALGGRLVELVISLTCRQLGGQAWVAAPGTAVARSAVALAAVTRALVPLLGILLMLAVAGQLAQVGLRFLPDKLIPDPRRISPAEGLRRLASGANLVRVGFGILKLAAILVVGAWCLWSERDRLLALGELQAAGIAASLAELVLWLGAKIAVALVLLGLADYGYQRWRLERALRMTDEELRQELRNQQGDPLVAQRRSKLRQTLASERSSPPGSVPPASGTASHGPERWRRAS